MIRKHVVVSEKVHDNLIKIRKDEEHSSLDSVIRTLLKEREVYLIAIDRGQ